MFDKRGFIPYNGNIKYGELMEGEFPPKAKALVKEFIQKYRTDLLQMWETEQYKKLPPLD